jgi:hypothetical protein
MLAISRFRVVCVAVTLVLGASIAPVVVPPVQAAVGDVVCTPPSSNTVSYSPALISSPQDVTVSVNFQLSSCVSTTVPATTWCLSWAACSPST